MEDRTRAADHLCVCFFFAKTTATPSYGHGLNRLNLLPSVGRSKMSRPISMGECLAYGSLQADSKVKLGFDRNCKNWKMTEQIAG